MPNSPESLASGDPRLAPASTLADLRRVVTERYAIPSIPRAVWQLTATALALVAVWWLSIQSLEKSFLTAC